MTALLDTLGATVIGAMFLLTIVTSMFNIQIMSHNYKMQMVLVETTERVTAGLENYYLSAVGTGLSSNNNIITTANSTELSFIGELDGTIRSIDIIREDFDNITNTYQLIVEVDNVENFGPFSLSNSNDGNLAGLEITYFDSNSSIIPISQLGSQVNRNRIRSVQFEIETCYETYRRDVRAIDNKHRIVFWKYFTNLYI